MKKARLEVFSDGVFAIVITLLILDIKLPGGSYADLPNHLIDLLPEFYVYILSFLLIGMYWVFHHFTFLLMKEVDGVLLWINILFLLFISFLPFPTSMLGKYPGTSIPMIFYGCNLVLANMTGLVSILYLKHNYHLRSVAFTGELYTRQINIYAVINTLYMFCIILSLYFPTLSYIGFCLIALFLVINSLMFMGVGKQKTES